METPKNYYSVDSFDFILGMSLFGSMITETWFPTFVLFTIYATVALIKPKDRNP